MIKFCEGKTELKCVVEFETFGIQSTTISFYFDDSVPKFIGKNVTNLIR